MLGEMEAAVAPRCREEKPFLAVLGMQKKKQLLALRLVDFFYFCSYEGLQFLHDPSERESV